MHRRTLTATVLTLCTALLTAIAAMLMGAPTAGASTTQQAYLTFYGYWDNTPPGSAIAYPQIHQTAGGTGTYADPITFATDKSELAPGTIIYVPRVEKYFIMEDDCGECDADWSGQGPDGGPNLWHFDLWLGGQGGNAMAAIDCEDALTKSNANGSPFMESAVVDPPSTETYDPTPIFNTSTNACYGGAKPTTTLGQWKNNSTGTCIDDPGDSKSNGVKLDMAACNGSAEQQFIFDGTFLQLNGLCADESGSSSLVLDTCTGGPGQQWSQNPNGTMSDIQTGKKCYQASGATLKTGSCSSSSAQWTFPTLVISGPGSSPSASASASPSASASVSASASASASASPSSTATAPAGGRTYLAASASLGGSADANSCTACTGGEKVSSVGGGGAGTVTFADVSESASGSYTMTVYYLAVGAAKPAVITVNGSSQTVNFPETSAGSYSVIGSYSVTVQLKTGSSNTIEFSGSGTKGAPDLSKIVV